MQAEAAFSSLYIFGDGVCTTTTTSNQPTAYYYGHRYCNGRVWVEVLAQRQGLTNNTVTNVDWSYSSNNFSYFGQFSSNLVQNLNNFPAPTDASTALFVVWVCDADFVGFISSYGPKTPGDTNTTVWTNAISLSLSNHFQALTNLYAKGARTLIMPNAVDITKVPEFSGLTSAEANFIRGMVIYFNTNFATLLNQATALLTNITIYSPDFFTLLNNMLANPGYYGLLNPYLGDYALLDGYTSLSNGPGTTYVFWDWLEPTAKAHEVMADTAQQLISPVAISKLTSLNGSNRLDGANIPLGLNGSVVGSTNVVLSLSNWPTVINVNSTNAVQSIFVPASGSPQFYRLCFPFAWSWP